MRTQELDFARVNRAAYNPRVDLKPGDPEWLDIEASLDEFGQVLNLVWNERTGNLVAGHQRMAVMQHKGQTSAVFAVVDLDLASEKKLNLALNKITGRWEPTKLQELMGELRLAKLDMTRLGWTPLELSKILGSKPKVTRRDPDAAAANLPAIPTTQSGDLYELISPEGTRHRLLCGDAQYGEHYDRLCNGERARLIFTDPPYNVAYRNEDRGDGRRPLGHVSNDAMPPDAFLELLTAAFRNVKQHSMETAALYTFLASATHVAFETALEAAGWQVKQQLIWAKHFALSRAHYHYAHEPMMYAVRAERNAEWFGPRTETTLWNTAPKDFEKLKKEELLALVLEVRETASIWHEARDHGANYVHPTQKPVGLVKKALLNSSQPGEVVLDPFAGSGSTIIGAELNDRVAFAMELDPGRCDVIVKRWFDVFEGAAATRNGQALERPA